MKIRLALLTLLVLSMDANAFIFGIGKKQKDIDLEKWPAEIYNKFSSEVSTNFDRAGLDFSNAIFESLTDLELYQGNVGNISIGATVKRRVYDNYDLLQSWTVVDTMNIPMSMPLYSSPSFQIPGVLSGGVSLSTRIGSRVINIRQARPSKNIDLEMLKELSDEIKEKDSTNSELISKIEEFNSNMRRENITEQNKQEGTSSDNDEGEDEDDNLPKGSYLPYKSADPEVYARYNHLDRLFTSALRIPFTSKMANKMGTGEIISYFVDGVVEVSLSAALINASEAVAQLGPRVGASAYIGGTYQISMLKEEGHFAKVKVARRVNDGHTFFIGTNGMRHVIYEGFMVFHRTVGKIDSDIVPFQFSINNSDSTLFDSGYRFDLSKPNAAKAYSKAMKGRFAYADELAKIGNEGVEFLFDRKLESKTKSKNHRIKLSLFFEKLHNQQAISSYAKITLPDGNHHIFKTVTVNSFGMDILDYFKEEESYKFTSIDDNPENGGAGQFGFTFEVNLKDKFTNGFEINRYMSIVENIIGRGRIFEHPPLYFPVTQTNNHVSEMGNSEQPQLSVANYGKSSFYLKVSLTNDQINDFVLADDVEVLAQINKVFDLSIKEDEKLFTLSNVGRTLVGILNAPLRALEFNVSSFDRYVAASDFYARWKKLREVRNTQELMQGIQNLIENRFFSAEFMQILTSFTRQNELAFSLIAGGDLLGQVLLNGKSFPDVVSHEAQISAVTDFEQDQAQYNYDNNASIGNFSVKAIDKDNVEIGFSLNEVPKFFFVMASRTNSWKPYVVLTRFIGVNQGVLKKGEQKIIINRNDQEGFKGRLAKVLFLGDYITISSSMSIDSKKWGPVVSSRFKSIEEKPAKPSRPARTSHDDPRE